MFSCFSKEGKRWRKELLSSGDHDCDDGMEGRGGSSLKGREGGLASDFSLEKTRKEGRKKKKVHIFVLCVRVCRGVFLS